VWVVRLADPYGHMDYVQITREQFRDHETARLQWRGHPNPERHAESLCAAWEELTARVGLRCWPALRSAPDDAGPLGAARLPRGSSLRSAG
jgi:hypothetical protein